MSGKELIAVSEYFGGVKNLGLGAEHGFYYRWPRDEKKGGAGGSDVSEGGPAGEGKEGNMHIKAKWQTLQEIGDQVGISVS